MVRSRRRFGRLRKLPSGRWQAAYIGLDTAVHQAPQTFFTRQDAEGWLSDRNREMSRGEWEPAKAPKAKPVTFGTYATTWLRDRTLKPRTRDHYEKLMKNQILPTFAEVPLGAVTPHRVRQWHTSLGTGTPTLRAHAYGLLRTVLNDAVHDGELAANPAHIRGAGTAKRVHKIEPATLGQLDTLVAALPVKYRVMTLLAAWCGLRFGELTELRRSDVDTNVGVLHVRRAVVRVGGLPLVGTPKTDAGTRDVAVPPHLIPPLKDHLTRIITGGKDGLLFPAADGVSHLAPSTLYKAFYRARDVAGRPDLRFHDLRHTGATLAAGAGASLAELMSRLGHATAGAAMTYQHTAQGRDRVLAEALSVMASQNARP